MACPKCDHTMQNIATIPTTTFWCPRCGTIKFIQGGHEESETPKGFVELEKKLAETHPDCPVPGGLPHPMCKGAG